MLQQQRVQQNLQKQAGPPPPTGFAPYKNNAASGGVMSMMQQIINDAKAMEQETIRDEEDAQKAYEDLVKDTNGSIKAKTNLVVDKSDTKALKESELAEEKHPARESAVLELEQLANYKAQLHQGCDFIMDNFDLRQKHRDEEVEALRQAT